MPAITLGASGRGVLKDRTTGLTNVNYDYDYPGELKLKPGSEEHDKLVSELLARAQDAHDALSQRFPVWNKMDKTLTTYIDLSKSEADLQDADPLKPVSIVFPNSYAILETLLTYMVMAFFQDPIFRYEGASAKDTVGAILLEKVIHQHCERAKVPLALHTQFRDNFAYGFGMSVPTWKVQRGLKPVVVDETAQNWLGQLKKTGQRIDYEEGVIFEGNSLQNVDPYNALLDPNVSITNFQDGEFIGWITNTNLMDLLTRELSDKEVFNVRYLKHLHNGETTITTQENSLRNLKSGAGARRDNNDSWHNKVDTFTLYVKLIPKEWKLSLVEYPEIWVFEVAGDSVIIRANKTGLAHGKFPVSIGASEYDGYSTTPLSRIEMLSGLQGVLDWMFNSHVANVRKSLNDMFVVDPYLVNINDLKDPRPGKLIRMRRPAWGQGVQNAVQQLMVNDVTRGNMGDAGMISQLMKTLSGTDSPIMGSLRQGGPERLSSAEYQGTQSGAIGRLERLARITSYQQMQEIAYFFASHTQQMMDYPTYVRTIGSWPKAIQETYGIIDSPIEVTPYDLVIDYDVLVRDGSIPGGNFSQSWIQLYQIISANPALMQKFDMFRIFKHIAVNLGAKNVSDFEARQVAAPQMQAMPDEEVEQQVQAGNFAPMQIPAGGMGI